MNNQRNKKHYSNEDAGTTLQLAIASGAIVVSLLLHFLGIASVSDIKITLFQNANLPKVDIDSKSFPPITVDIEKTQELIEAENLKIAEAFHGEDETGDYSETPQPMPESVFQAKNIANKFLPGTGSKTVELDEVDYKPNPEMWLPRIDVVEIDRKAVADIDLADLTRIEVPKIERFENAPDVVFQTPPVVVSSVEFVELPSFVPSAKPMGVQGAEKYIENTKVAEPLHLISEEALANSKTTSDIDNRVLSVPEPEIVPEPIEDVLKPQLTVYKPGFLSSDDYIYFRVDISRKSETDLPVINRDVLFVQDASESIGNLRIGIVRENLKKLVDALQPSDRFNIMAFNEESSLCLPNAWMSAAEPGAKVMANQFINGIQAKGNTDIYRAIEDILDLPTDPNRVLLVILLTDGSTTKGKITQDTEIISAFSQMNGGNASVFSISPGRKGNNDYLLSMLSFLNRGGPATMVKDRFETTSAAMNVFTSIARPVLTDVSFIFDSLSAAEVAPRNTTHLYLDTPLYIFGRVKKDVESVTFQAKGKSYGKDYDMIFELPIDDPNVKKGESIIRKEWARARMFDLFAEYEKTKSSILAQEMRSLADEYDVTIPFEERIR